MSKRFHKLAKVERDVPNALVKICAAAPPKVTSRSENAIHLRLSLLLALIFLFGCETANYAPLVTPQMAAATSKKGTHVDVAKLREGRTLFVHRCIECHTLPAIWRYSAQDWPGIVNSMAHRASLKPVERDAVIAYILAARAQQ